VNSDLLHYTFRAISWRQPTTETRDELLHDRRFGKATFRDNRWYLHNKHNTSKRSMYFQNRTVSSLSGQFAIDTANFETLIRGTDEQHDKNVLPLVGKLCNHRNRM